MPQQHLLQQQQRTARIDQIMKLFPPEQNGNLLSSLQNQSSQPPQQPIHLINYPLAMECDPTPTAMPSNSSGPMGARYNLSGIGGTVRHRPMDENMSNQLRVGQLRVGIGGYIPYSMSSDAINASMPTNNQVQISSNNKKLSNSSSGTSSSVSGQSVTAASRSTAPTANDRGDESPMVGVCVQQSPVVIH